MKATGLLRPRLAPQPTDVQMLARTRRVLAATVPLKRVGRPEEIAETIMFFVSDKASFITGASYRVTPYVDIRRTTMNQTIESKNKALVLEAFDTLFNKRDYAAAERYWSPNYIQHSAHIAPGRDG